MRSIFRRLRVNGRNDAHGVWALVFSSVVSCGGPTTPTSAPAQANVTSQTPGGQPTKPALERQPAPAGLFLVGRVTQPKALVARLAEWCHLPFDLEDALALAGDGVERSVHLDQPVDFALSLAPERDVDEEQDYPPDPAWGLDAGAVSADIPPEVNAIVSLAVSEPDALLGALRRAGKSVEARDNGEFVIEIERDLRCSLGPALGASPHRLTCGASEYDLDALGAFARTNLATQPLSSKAAYFELRAEPFRLRHGDEIRQLKAMLPEFLREVNIGSERFDRAMGQVTRASVDEFVAWVDGVDTWNFSVDITPDRDVFIGESTLAFRKDKSYFSNLLRRTAAENAVAPALFWDLPQDVHGASFSARTSVNEDDRVIASALSELLAGGLEHWGVASGVADGWLRSLQQLLESRGTVVVASGTTTAPASKKSNSLGLLDAYYLIGIEGDRGAYVQAWKSSVATFNDKRLRRELAERLDEELRQLPLIRSRRIPHTKISPPIELFDLTFKLPEAPVNEQLRLDKLSLHLAMTVVGERTWIGVGFSEAVALQQVRRVSSGVDYPKLGDRQGLDSLHQRRVLHGSFGTFQAYAKLLSGLPILKDPRSLSDDILRAMPHRGSTPTIFDMTTSAVGPSMTTRLEVPREVFADGSAFIMALAAASTSALLDFSEEEE